MFREASDKEPELVYHLNLPGGVLGLHRFNRGKVFSGMLYCLTCGLLLMGWGIDLLFLFAWHTAEQAKTHSAATEAPTAKIAVAPG